MSDTPQLLLAHHLKALRLPTFLREYDKLAQQCAAEGVDHPRYLLRLAELELIERERRMIERRIKEARFPTVKSLDSFDFTAIPSLKKTLVLELARCEYIARRENVIAVGNSGTGKTHITLGLGLAACQKGLSVGFITAAALVHELIEARDEKRLLRLQRQLTTHKLLIIDELGYVPLSTTGAELLFEVFSQRYERGNKLTAHLDIGFNLERYQGPSKVSDPPPLPVEVHGTPAVARVESDVHGSSFSIAIRAAITSIHVMLMTPSAKSATISMPLQPTQKPPCSAPARSAPPTPGRLRSKQASRQWRRHLPFAAVSS